ncbi:MAG: hypothetical protein JSS83_12030 [Cyanobacteria bacterium SZAS LIN-3]|nr:hypothetical protein [Cyanobacteria bacterium SZAS LIN-3]
MSIETAAELSGLARFLIALLALAVSYMTVLFCVFKYEGGLYEEHAIPPVVSPQMRRARRFFLILVVGTAALAGLAGFVLYPLVDHTTWVNYVQPILLGIGFSMLYGGSTRYHRIRPRD